MLIYHERQEAMLCGQHALNNLVQSAMFDVSGLSQIAHQLDEVELTYMAQNEEGGIRSKEYIQRISEGSGNVDSSGNFSLQVLRAALQNTFRLGLPNLSQEGVLDNVKDVTDIDGFICNKQAHWFAIRKINGRYWNLNSMNSYPIQISHFNLAREIENLRQDGYHVFFVDGRLPPPCESFEEINGRGAPGFWWDEQDLLKGAKENSTNADTNHWRQANVGSGFRLDGKSSQVSENNTPMQGLTEEEMIQMALAASMEETQQSSKNKPEKHPKILLSPEPSTTDPNAAKIQFRLPDGSRAIRRFIGSDCVAMIFAFVESRCPNGKPFELRAGFPPKVITYSEDCSIHEAKLNGEMVQGRFL